MGTLRSHDHFLLPAASFDFQVLLTGVTSAFVDATGDPDRYIRTVAAVAGARRAGGAGGGVAPTFYNTRANTMQIRANHSTFRATLQSIQNEIASLGG